MKILQIIMEVDIFCSMDICVKYFPEDNRCHVLHKLLISQLLLLLFIGNYYILFFSTGTEHNFCYNGSPVVVLTCHKKSSSYEIEITVKVNYVKKVQIS